MLIHESDGRSRGFVLMWKRKIRITVKDITANFIVVFVDSGDE
jgi:hypothetical protein